MMREGDEKKVNILQLIALVEAEILDSSEG